MKKTATIVLAAALALLLAGCNLDANQGIFREISTSTKSSGIRIVEAAGYDASTQTAYFVADNGLMAQKKGEAATMLVPSSASRQIKQATLYNDGTDCIRFLAQDTADGNKTSYHTYNLSDGGIQNNPIAEGDQILLGAGMEVSLSDGAITITDLGTGSSDATITTASSALQVLSFVEAKSSTRELLLTWKDADGKPNLDFFVVSDTTPLAKHSLITTQVDGYADIAAFAYDSANGRLLLAGRNGGLYYCDGSDWKLKPSKSLEGGFQPTSGFGFHSTEAADKFVFKCDSSFNIVQWAADTAKPSSVEAKTGGFASGLANETVSGVAGTEEGKALAFVLGSGIFVLNVVADSSEKF